MKYTKALEIIDDLIENCNHLSCSNSPNSYRAESKVDFLEPMRATIERSRRVSERQEEILNSIKEEVEEWMIF